MGNSDPPKQARDRTAHLLPRLLDCSAGGATHGVRRMATVSVGRGAKPTQSVYRGRALSRVDAEPTQEERMELLDDIKFAKKATKMIELAARRLRRHNYDKGKGQPGWCSIETKQGPNSRVMSAGPEFAGLIYNVGPARSEVEAMMEWGCDFQSTGGEACTATAESRRVAFTFPPDVYPKIDWHMMEFLDDLGDALAPCEMGRFADPLG